MDRPPHEPEPHDLESLEAKLASLRPPMPELNWPELWKEQGRAEVRREHAALASAQHAAASRPRTSWAWPLITAASLLLASTASWDRFAMSRIDLPEVTQAPPTASLRDDSAQPPKSVEPSISTPPVETSAQAPTLVSTSMQSTFWQWYHPLSISSKIDTQLFWRERLASGNSAAWEAWDHRAPTWRPTSHRTHRSKPSSEPESSEWPRTAPQPWSWKSLGWRLDAPAPNSSLPSQTSDSKELL